jgi:C-terminal processing protease CtpA/Prc
VSAAAVVQLIEGQVVVVRIVDSAAARAGLSVGDVVTSVDGEATAARIARLSPYFVASTPQALRARLANFFLAGRDSMPARLVVQHARGRSRTVRIPRSTAYPPPSYEINRDGPVVRLLPGNIGYVDLERLTVPMVDSTLAALAGTRGIVFDGRGYPATPAWVLVVARLNQHPAPTLAARFEELVVPSPDTARTTVVAFTQPLRMAEGPRYSGRTALLIDERAISQAEHLGLWFEAANGTVFVGSPTAGANGAVTSVQLPGDIRVSFTGARVRHADGRALQRVGLQPQVHVTPTVAGIREGRDEVLECAVACLATNDCAPSAH